MSASLIRCCITDAVAKETNTCVSPGRVSSAVSSDMIGFTESVICIFVTVDKHAPGWNYFWIYVRDLS